MKNCIIFLFCSFCILLSLKANVLNPESECKITFSSPWPIECKSSNKHYIVFSYKRLVENAFGLNKVPLPSKLLTVVVRYNLRHVVSLHRVQTMVLN